MNTYYSYFIEVPAGLSRLLVHIYDADVGMGSPETNDWDGDNGASTLCTIRLRSRTRNFSSAFNGSGSTVWLNTPLSGFTRDEQASDYGVWDVRLSYTDTGANANFGVFYAGNYSAANPPPTGQPESNTFRIYFRANDGNPPLKPFLTQNLSHVSGPNPPANGSTTRINVALTIFNPSAQSITFSSSNLVTANIPGSGAVYAGNASVTQGSITSQPAVGGTGNITWNPGTVTGSSNSEILYYDVDVTPTSAGQRIPVTGSPGANGTTATYVDETGNTTQTRATFTFGPLCELAVTEGTAIPTLAAISSFKAYEQDGQVVVHWETDSEIGTSGFSLLRQDDSSRNFCSRGRIDSTTNYQQINKQLLTGLLNSTAGGSYRYVDETARYGETYTYKLVEVESDGSIRSHGPFTVTVGAKEWDDSSPVTYPLPGSYSKKPRPVSAEKKARLRARQQELAISRTLAQSKGRNYLKITVKEKGLYYVSAAEIASALRLSPHQIESKIHNHSLRLLNRGKNVAWHPAKGNAGLYFYGESIDIIHTKENIYCMKTGRGLRMQFANGGSPMPESGEKIFQETIHIEEDHYALTALFENPEADFWLWDFMKGGESGKTFKFYAHGAASWGTASLSLHLKGATATSVEPDHCRGLIYQARFSVIFS